MAELTPPPHFLRALVAADQARGAYGGRVVTRFPPEPNGYLHIGHAKSICLNFGLAQEFGGVCHLRYDDTNPETEREEYVAKILEYVRWLGFDPGDKVFFASDYFPQLYAYARLLIQKGKAYVCDLPDEEISRQRGAVGEPGVESPYRARSVAENLDLFERMQAGEFAEGSRVLRAKIDMANPNFKMRDPLLYRIKFAHHYRTGDTWKVYPFYDFAHCLSDAIERITHSICTLEFENNRELYDWILRECEIVDPPHQHEFARLNLTYTVMSKRRFIRLVDEGRVSGWDDPRMPTLAGLRRRGVTPEALRALAERVGVAKSNSVVELELFENLLREDLNARSPRGMAVLRPLKLRIQGWSGGEVEGSWFPADVSPPARFAGEANRRRLPMGDTVYIDASDFSEAPPKGWHRLSPGGTVRLVHGPVVRCDEVRKGADGALTELVCTVVEGKPKGTLQWVDAATAVPAELRLYDRLVKVERPTADDFIEELNPKSLEVVQGLVERAVAEGPGPHWQFLRLGYFFRDPVEAAAGRLVFNRTAGLREGWKPEAEAAEVAATPRPAPKAAEPAARPAPPRALDPDVAARRDDLIARFGLAEAAARTLAAEPALVALFEAAAAAGPPPAVATFLANVVLGELRTAKKAPGEVDGAAIGRLVALVDGGTLGAPQARRVLEVLLAEGGDPAAIVQREGLAKVTDPARIGAWVDEVLARFPAELARHRAGQANLAGFFVGQVLKLSGGKADAAVAQQVLGERLG